MIRTSKRTETSESGKRGRRDRGEMGEENGKEKDMGIGGRGKGGEKAGDRGKELRETAEGEAGRACTEQKPSIWTMECMLRGQPHYPHSRVIRTAEGFETEGETRFASSKQQELGEAQHKEKTRQRREKRVIDAAAVVAVRRYKYRSCISPFSLALKVTVRSTICSVIIIVFYYFIYSWVQV